MIRDIIPQDKFILFDAGVHTAANRVLAPYRSIRYHLRELSVDPRGAPLTPKQLFNLRHSVKRSGSVEVRLQELQEPRFALRSS